MMSTRKRVHDIQPIETDESDATIPYRSTINYEESFHIDDHSSTDSSDLEDLSGLRKVPTYGELFRRGVSTGSKKSESFRKRISPSKTRPAASTPYTQRTIGTLSTQPALKGRMTHASSSDNAGPSGLSKVTRNSTGQTTSTKTPPYKKQPYVTVINISSDSSESEESQLNTRHEKPMVQSKLSLTKNRADRFKHQNQQDTTSSATDEFDLVLIDNKRKRKPVGSAIRESIVGTKKKIQNFVAHCEESTDDEQNQHDGSWHSLNPVRKSVTNPVPLSDSEESVSMLDVSGAGKDQNLHDSSETECIWKPICKQNDSAARIHKTVVSETDDETQDPNADIEDDLDVQDILGIPETQVQEHRKYKRRKETPIETPKVQTAKVIQSNISSSESDSDDWLIKPSQTTKQSMFSRKTYNNKAYGSMKTNKEQEVDLSYRETNKGAVNTATQPFCDEPVNTDQHKREGIFSYIRKIHQSSPKKLIVPAVTRNDSTESNSDEDLLLKDSFHSSKAPSIFPDKKTSVRPLNPLATLDHPEDPFAFSDDDDLPITELVDQKSSKRRAVSPVFGSTRKKCRSTRLQDHTESDKALKTSVSLGMKDRPPQKRPCTPVCDNKPCRLSTGTSSNTILYSLNSIGQTGVLADLADDKKPQPVRGDEKHWPVSDNETQLPFTDDETQDLTDDEEQQPMKYDTKQQPVTNEKNQQPVKENENQSEGDEETQLLVVDDKNQPVRNDKKQFVTDDETQQYVTDDETQMFVEDDVKIEPATDNKTRKISTDNERQCVTFNTNHQPLKDDEKQQPDLPGISKEPDDAEDVTFNFTQQADVYLIESDDDEDIFPMSQSFVQILEEDEEEEEEMKEADDVIFLDPWDPDVVNNAAWTGDKGIFPEVVKKEKEEEDLSESLYLTQKAIQEAMNNWSDDDNYLPDIQLPSPKSPQSDEAKEWSDCDEELLLTLDLHPEEKKESSTVSKKVQSDRDISRLPDKTVTEMLDDLIESDPEVENFEFHEDAKHEEQEAPISREFHSTHKPSESSGHPERAEGSVTKTSAFKPNTSSVHSERTAQRDIDKEKRNVIPSTSDRMKNDTEAELGETKLTDVKIKGGKVQEMKALASEPITGKLPSTDKPSESLGHPKIAEKSVFKTSAFKPNTSSVHSERTAQRDIDKGKRNVIPSTSDRMKNETGMEVGETILTEAKIKGGQVQEIKAPAPEAVTKTSAKSKDKPRSSRDRDRHSTSKRASSKSPTPSRTGKDRKDQKDKIEKDMHDGKRNILDKKGQPNSEKASSKSRSSPQTGKDRKDQKDKPEKDIHDGKRNILDDKGQSTSKRASSRSPTPSKTAKDRKDQKDKTEKDIHGDKRNILDDKGQSTSNKASSKSTSASKSTKDRKDQKDTTEKDPRGEKRNIVDDKGHKRKEDRRTDHSRGTKEAKKTDVKKASHDKNHTDRKVSDTNRSRSPHGKEQLKRKDENIVEITEKIGHKSSTSPVTDNTKKYAGAVETTKSSKSSASDKSKSRHQIKENKGSSNTTASSSVNVVDLTSDKPKSHTTQWMTTSHRKEDKSRCHSTGEKTQRKDETIKEVNSSNPKLPSAAVAKFQQRLRGEHQAPQTSKRSRSKKKSRSKVPEDENLISMTQSIVNAKVEMRERMQRAKEEREKTKTKKEETPSTSTSHDLSKSGPRKDNTSAPSTKKQDKVVEVKSRDKTTSSSKPSTTEESKPKRSATPQNKTPSKQDATVSQAIEDITESLKNLSQGEPQTKTAESSVITNRPTPSTSSAVPGAKHKPPVRVLEKRAPFAEPQAKRPRINLPRAAVSSSTGPGTIMPGQPADPYELLKALPELTIGDTGTKLTADHFLSILLQWIPNWLEETEALESGVGPKRLPPIMMPAVRGDYPVLKGDTLWPVPDTFENPKEYLEIMLGHILHEVWAALFSSWRRSKDRPVIVPLIPVSKSPTYNVLNTLIFQGLVARNQQFPFSDGSFVIVHMKVVRRDGKRCDPQPVFGYVQQVSKMEPRHPDNLHRKLGNFNRVKNAKQMVVNVTIRMFYRTNPDDDFMDVQEVTSLITVMRQIEALISFPRNPLSRDLLQPISLKTFLPTDDLMDKNIEKLYNRSQARVVNAVVTSLLQPLPVPRVSLIQGPPGTGKSHTILAIIRNTIFRKTVDGLTPCLMLCAPSNAAIDELVRRMSMENDIRRKQNETMIRVVRIGSASSMSATSLPYSLDTKVKEAWQTRKLLEKMNMMPMSIRKEMIAVHEQLPKLKAQLEAARASSSPEEIRRLEQDLAFMENKKSKFEETGKRNEPTGREMAQLRHDVLAHAHIVACTLNSAGSRVIADAVSLGKTQVGNPSYRGPRFQFTGVLIDEACQCVEVDALIPLQYCVTKLVLIGDPKQLPPTVISQDAETMKYSQSLFERLYNYFRVKGFAVVHLLDTQYRMHPEIAVFPSQHVYDGRLKTDSTVADKRSLFPFKPYFVYDVVYGKEQSDFRSLSMGNPAEVEFVLSLVRHFTSVKVKPQVIGIITPYKKQQYLIQDQLRNCDLSQVAVGTVDGFQGQEKDVIIVSCVRACSGNKKIGFVADKRRMNVALTRAKYGCYVVGHLESLKVDKDWGALVKDAIERRVVVQVKRSSERESIIKKVTAKSSARPHAKPHAKQAAKPPVKQAANNAAKPPAKQAAKPPVKPSHSPPRGRRW